MNYSPLRYPGGKNKLSAFIAKICIDFIDLSKYDLIIEPSAGSGSFSNNINNVREIIDKINGQMQEINNSTIESSNDGKKMSSDFRNLKALADEMNETMKKFKVWRLN